MAVFDLLNANLRLSLAALTLTAAAAGTAQAAGDPLGVWLNDTGRGAVEIKRCGKALCGHVVWVKDGKDAKGCGKQIIGNATPVGGDTWDGGWIYSPEKRKTYDVELKPLANGTLRVTGYAGVRFLSKTMIWTRAPADLKRCGETAIEAKAEPKAPVSKTAETTPQTPNTASAPPPVAKPQEAQQAAAPVTQPVTQPVTPPASQPVTQPAAPPSSPATAEVSKPAEAPAPGSAEDAKVAATPAGEPAPQPGDGEAAAKPETPAESAAKGEAQSEPGNDDKVVDNGPPTPREKSRLALGNLDLDKVLTRTKSGRCKLDLPFVKVQFDCNRD